MLTSENSSPMTPTPIPEWFEKAVKDQAEAQYPESGMNKDGDKKSRAHQRAFIEGAKFLFSLLSAQQVRWVKASDELPKEDKFKGLNIKVCGLATTYRFYDGSFYWWHGGHKRWAKLVNFTMDQIEWLYEPESPAPIQ